MKLKNKKTGEIDDFIFEVIIDRIDLYRRVGYSETKNVWHYNSLAELNEEWEDYEEPKEDGLDNIIALADAYSSHDSERYPKEIVEKLKAWKRLKDKGFHFLGWNSTFKGDTADFYIDWIDADSKDELVKDLDLLFRGEE